MKSLMKEIQNLTREFEEESKEREECFNKVKDIADTMKKDLEIRTGEWDEKWNELEKREEERDAKQDRVEERLSKLENLIKERGENMENVNIPEREKEREDTINELTWRLEDPEKRARRNNIIIHGIAWQGENIREKIQEWIKEKLGIEVVIIRCWKIKGQEKTEGAECEKESMKREIMINKKKVKGSEVYIDKDLTFKERGIRRKLKAIAREQVEKGKRATVRDDAIIIDGRLWKWSEKDQNIFQTGKKWEEKKNQGAGQ
ncbi:hypothetical protein QAD02_003645 [Eretmocerus hayati]|uniref:Uncharacterized protein n=1 Tax=Eretmocerus hayati TaxID=131215 RepID=A0ACC2NP44_9HYME|nr:hypothetical protein QAD02_003645 [Eretmocerus hayati]